MQLAGLLAATLDDPVVAASRKGGTDLELTGPPALRPFVAAAATNAAAGEGTVLAVTATTREAEELAAALGDLLPEGTVEIFPAWETLPHERLSPRSDTVGRRLAVLRRLAGSNDVRVVVAPVRSVLQPQLEGLGDLVPVELRAGQRYDLDDTVTRLVDIAYNRVDLVEKRGEFAVRGGILDIFPPTEQHPLRVEFWGDDVEEIRYFAVADQRSLDKADVLVAPPCRELLLTAPVRARAAELAGAYPGLAEMCAKLAEGIAVEGMESLAPVLGAGRLELLLDCLPTNTTVVLCDPERIRGRAADLVRTSEEFLEASWAAAAVGGQAPIDLGAATFRSLGDVAQHARELGQRWWSLSPFGIVDEADLGGLESTSQPAPLYHGDGAALLGDVRRWAADGWRVVLVFAGHGPAERALELLREADMGPLSARSLDTLPERGRITVTTGNLEHGLIDEAHKLAIITGNDVTGGRGATNRDAVKMPSRRRNTIDPLELRAGDLVVHEQHGIGRYVELVQRTVNGAEREYLVIEYAATKKNQPGDRLFVPTDQLDQLSRYVGGENPTLHKMGGSDWQKSKARARKAVREIAAQLIQLYAARQNSKGHAFGPDTPWQRELEDAFPWTETPDQLSAIDEVKGDMEKQVPMDRLICGDVGYGKTEIAVRAAFKAVQDGKQVAVLVPTTLLAQQHFNTFTERMSQFPVTIRQLSRFQTPRETTLTLEALANGSADIVIGTHRLLSASTKFKQLGLVIVDEEQRFGVEHKEHLKALRTNVDVLAMSATPIPRTLEMAITGIREMSTIATPPEERHPVLTSVAAYEEKTVAATIRRELLRDGQVFYLHNRVESIDRTAKKLRELVPEARIVTAHGQMGEDALEKVMVGFWEKEFDVLIATTIIESGIDIPNANTLIVERADLLGLSQLHQIRGRVGRGRERAYAYFLYPPEKPLTEHAHERLATIAQHTELGAGMFVAMKDLEIRGAGNLLGGEQSGHIEGVGFDLYIRMVGEAVASFKGDTAEEEPADVKVDLPVDAHIPHDYISAERLRLEMYRKLAEVRDLAGLEAVTAELRDRYGNPPEPVANLVEVAGLRLAAREYGLADISVQGKFVRFGPLVLPDSKQMRLKRLYPEAVYKQAADTISLPRPSTRRVGGEPLRDVPLMRWCREFLSSLLD
ncbi:transcription-repair-coupling factor [Longispora fulva]|uniref:Transcription-repair-coupling factor n=1 Tax=Longispora fulva TaxID=619741 RepID=A0A8J7GLI8_9ACTN|nr:transcription-repair coupling factor [Longispora fulva]MBG6138968.1 transcription-repair coupling factor (superfamily II helicase) [Longispora fulva]GIG58461.1 transcription-repair-coupling factor [Longispora fulva]